MPQVSDIFMGRSLYINGRKKVKVCHVTKIPDTARVVLSGSGEAEMLDWMCAEMLMCFNDHRCYWNGRLYELKE